MYDYFVWLRDELARMEGNGRDRQKVQASGISVPSLAGLVCKMEATFRGLGSEEDAARRRRGGRGRKKVEEEEAPTTGAREEAEDATTAKESAGGSGAAAATTTGDSFAEAPPAEEAPGTEPELARAEPRPPPPPPPLPFLEERLKSELARRVASSAPEVVDGDSSGAPDAALDERAWTRRSFGALLGVLTDHRNREGNAAPPSAHPELGRWVLSLRRNKKRLRAAGSEWEPEDEEEDEEEATTSEADGAGRGKGKEDAATFVGGAGGGVAGARDDDDARNESGSLLVSNARLSRSRVDALDALGFAWNAGPRRAAWDDRLAELVRFEEDHGRFPTNREGSLGRWLKVQRKLYARGDEEFLRTKRRRVRERGWDRMGTVVSPWALASPRGSAGPLCRRLRCVLFLCCPEESVVWIVPLLRCVEPSQLGSGDPRGEQGTEERFALASPRGLEEPFCRRLRCVLFLCCPLGVHVCMLMPLECSPCVFPYDVQLEEIGVQLKPNQFTLMSYEDRFQQLVGALSFGFNSMLSILVMRRWAPCPPAHRRRPTPIAPQVEYGRVNGHYNVPDPVADNPRATMDDLDRDTEKARRFHKWVKKVRAAYRSAGRSGGVRPGDFLTADRVARLREIGFDADAKVKAKSPVPLLDWPTRLRQLEAFRAEVGHLRVDPRYECQSNLGGWAAAASEKYKAWREGTEALDPETAGQFDRLWAMGFRFDVFPVHRGKKEGARSWEDNFELLLRYRDETGNCRVPHGYKADMR
ncbi:hypothetical protein ACHAWF_005212 [Thalassiosira exigua]